MTGPLIAIVDYGMGNIRSVQYACDALGFDTVIADAPHAVEAADGVILPGVGAFGDAMDVLNRRGLTDALRGAVDVGKPVLGVCLGMQLLLDESHEFGTHRGLGLIAGSVKPLAGAPGGDKLRVPHVGWARADAVAGVDWDATPLRPVESGTYLYFVHSFYCDVADPAVVVTTTTYGGVEFCSSLQVGNVFACQFHPERSGPEGLSIYRSMFEPAVARATEGALQ